MSANRRGYRAFGLHWSSEIPLARFSSTQEAAEPDVIVEVAEHPLGNRTVTDSVGRGELCDDGYRLRVDDTTYIDVIGSNRVHLARHTNTIQGDAPGDLYGTIAAVVVAANGMLPLHGSVVEHDGAGVLVTGDAGAGKSSTAAAIVELGGRLVSDDLSAVSTRDGQVVAWPGRTDLRLHPDAAQRLAMQVETLGTSPGLRGKHCVSPAAHADHPVPVSHWVHLHTAALAARPAVAATVEVGARSVFRPRLMDRLPLRRERSELLLATIGQAAPQLLQRSGAVDSMTYRRLAERLLDQIH